MVAWRFMAALFAGLATPGAAARSEIAGPVAARILEVVDGDTVRVAARIWIGQTVEILVRIAGVDAPELRGPACDAERAAAKEAKRFVETLLAGGAASLRDIEKDKYGGRAVARLETSEGADVGEALLAAGHAVPLGEAGRWCN